MHTNTKSSTNFSTRKQANWTFTNWELLIIFIGFISMVCLIISVYATRLKEKFYPWGPIAYGGPWGIPTRYPIRGLGWDIRGYPAPYSIYYNGYGYPSGQTTYPAPEPNSSVKTLQSINTNSSYMAPFGIEMTTKPMNNASNKKNKSSTPTNNNTPVSKAANNDETIAAEWYEKERKWWPDLVDWPWTPYFNYDLHYDVNGKLKSANNDSIVANHTW